MTDFLENRARFPLEELRKFDGNWVAFSADGQRIVASGMSIADLANQLRGMNVELGTVKIEHVEMECWEIFLGAAELVES